MQNPAQVPHQLRGVQPQRRGVESAERGHQGEDRPMLPPCGRRLHAEVPQPHQVNGSSLVGAPKDPGIEDLTLSVVIFETKLETASPANTNRARFPKFNYSFHL